MPRRTGQARTQRTGKPRARRTAVTALATTALALSLAPGPATATDVARNTGPVAGSTAADPMATVVPVERLAGADRVATAVEVSRAGWDASEVAVIAQAGDFPDALAGGPLAAAHDAPLLLTPGAALADLVGSELARLGVERVLLLGGPSAVSPEVEAELATMVGVERLAGPNRYATAGLIAERVARAADAGDRTVDEVIVANGMGFADALAAANLVVGGGAVAPIVLTEPEGLPPASRASLATLAVDTATVVGGRAVVEDTVLSDLDTLGITASRIAGSDRYATAAAVLEQALDRVPATARPLVLASGATFADALTAGPLTSRLDGALALSAAGHLPGPISDVLAAHTERVAGVRVIGGPSALSEEAVTDLRRALGEDEAPPGGQGTREDPFGIGTRVEVADGWQLSVRAVDPDATDRILAFNEFNDPPAPGHQFFTATVRLTSTGAAPSRSDAGFRLRAVGGQGVVYSTFSDRCGVIPERIADRMVFPGGTVEGDVCWQIRSADADSLVTFDADADPRSYFALSGGPAAEEPLPTPPPPSAGGAGSRGNPHPAGTPVTLEDGWQVTITGADRDATDRVLAHNAFNDPPAPGHQFAIVEVRASYRGREEPSRFDGRFRLGAVGTSGAIGYRTFTDSCGVIPDRLEDPEVYPGGTITGNLCWQVRSPDAATLTVYDTDHEPLVFLALP